MAKIVAFVPDMIDRSRVAAAAAAAGRELEMVRAPAELPGRIDEQTVMVLVDLGRPGVLEVLPLLEGAPSVGFVSHVDRDLMRSARSAGCGRVLARSAFFSRLAALLSGDAGEADDP